MLFLFLDAVSVLRDPRQELTDHSVSWELGQDEYTIIMVSFVKRSHVKKGKAEITNILFTAQ